MQKLILTSSGFDNKRIEEKFLELINLPNEHIRVLFIPTAAITDEQRAIIPLCKNDLLNAGILEENIYTYNLDRKVNIEEIGNFNAIYVCGGDTQYLLSKIIEAQFRILLEKFLDNGGVYVGVSAGSIVLAKNSPSCLGYVNCILSVHAKEGTENGQLDTRDCPNIKLTDNQGIVVRGSHISILE